MLKRDDLQAWVLYALKQLGGKGRIKDITKIIWSLHRNELEQTDLLYTWQYDMRWAATVLRKKKKLKEADGKNWELS
jgi:hypothetical protein